MPRMSARSQVVLRDAFLADVTVKQLITRLGGTKAVADTAGVSVRTAQRWAQSGKLPASPGGQRLTAATSPRTPIGRGLRSNPRRNSALRRRGGTLHFVGVVATVSGQTPDERPRTIDYDFDGEQMGAVLDAWQESGPAAAHQALNRLLTVDYMHGEGNTEGRFMEIREFEQLELRPRPTRAPGRAHQ